MQSILFTISIIFLILPDATSQESKDKANEWIPKIVEYRKY